jgi:hypothetical protein
MQGANDPTRRPADGKQPPEGAGEVRVMYVIFDPRKGEYLMHITVDCTYLWSMSASSAKKWIDRAEAEEVAERARLRRPECYAHRVTFDKLWRPIGA